MTAQARHAPTGLRVCHIVATTDGARWVYEQLRELRDVHGMDVTAIVSGDSGPLVDLLRAAGIRFIPFAFGFDRGARHLPGRVVAMARLLRNEGFDVVQTHVFPSMMVGRFAAWLADVPLRVAMVAGPFHLEAEASRAIDRDTLFMDHLLIPSCELSRTIYRSVGVAEDRLALIYYGPDARRFDPDEVAPAGVREEYGWAPDAPVVAMIAYFYEPFDVGALIPAHLRGRGVKGHEVFVEAAGIVRREFPDARFLVVGGGYGPRGLAYRQEIIAHAERRGLPSSMVFTDHRTDVPEILKDIDVAVQASLSENLGGVLETGLMARPLVASRVGGMVDGVRDGQTGILVRPDDPVDLARGICDLLRDRRRAVAFGEAARQLMLERFTLDRTAADLAELYETTAPGGSFSLLRSGTRAVAAVAVAAYVVARLWMPEAPIWTSWDRVRVPRRRG